MNTRVIGGVNSWLAHRAIKLLQPDDVIWVHDYHLIPFGEALRSEGVTNRMGFFLHIPFPSPQILPQHSTSRGTGQSLWLLRRSRLPDPRRPDRFPRLHRASRAWKSIARWRSRSVRPQAENRVYRTASSPMKSPNKLLAAKRVRT